MLDYGLFNKIEDSLYYLPSEESPILSADIGVFIGGKFVWSFDCGASVNAFNALKAIDNLNIVISHFHKDHSYNLNNLSNFSNLYVGKYTFDHYNIGNIVREDIYFEDNGLIHIFPLPNSHSKGSLGMEINEKYIFMGDSTYGKHIDRHITYNAQLLLEQYHVLEHIKADKCLLSHDMQNICDKETILSKFEKILSKRKSSESVIVL